ncbi:MAG: 3-phosphoshikimate 1-carboxyvinyltransferase [Pseudomonadota bacterium]|jgi:3-phosphoshikimate 1-carboxyvinyltransferase
MKALKLTPPGTPISHSFEVLGSKSYTNRSLVIAALASGVSNLSMASISADSEAMIQALRLLGVSIEEETGPYGTTLIVEGTGGALNPYHGEINVGPAGTTMRFLTALCAAIPGIDVVLSGTERMHARPIKELVTVLRSLGAEIDYLGSEGCPPLRVRSRTHLKGGTIQMNGTVSSQFISAVLLTAPLHTNKLIVEIEGEQISKSYIDMTLQSIQEFGVTINNDSYRRYVCAAGQKYQSRVTQIEGDASGASYLWGLAAISGGKVTVKNVNPQSAQGDIHFPEVLMRMGCSVSSDSRSITVVGSKVLKGIEIDMSNMPDVAQTLAVIAAFAQGDTIMRGLSTLRVKETDRIAALRTELEKVGISSDSGPDYLIVHGGTPHGARIATYEDHRMAMSFAMMGARVPGIEIEEPNVVEKSFPTFWDALAESGITVSQ